MKELKKKDYGLVVCGAMLFGSGHKYASGCLKTEAAGPSEIKDYTAIIECRESPKSQEVPHELLTSHGVKITGIITACCLHATKGRGDRLCITRSTFPQQLPPDRQDERKPDTKILHYT
jgi:hypothetical protein